MAVASIDQAIGRAISSALFGLRGSVHIVDTTSERWKSSSRLGRRPLGSSLLEGPPAALIERFRNELGGGQSSGHPHGREPNRAKPSVTQLETMGRGPVPYTFGYRKHSLGATRIDLTRFSAASAERQIGKGPVTPFRATVAPFPAWRGSRFRVDRAIRAHVSLAYSASDWLPEFRRAFSEPRPACLSCVRDHGANHWESQRFSTILATWPELSIDSSPGDDRVRAVEAQPGGDSRLRRTRRTSCVRSCVGLLPRWVLRFV